MPSEYAREIIALRHAKGSETLHTVGLTVVQVADHNPKRIAIIFGGDFTNAVFVSTNPGVTAATGIPITVTGGAFKLTIDEVGALIQKQWFASANNAGAKLTVMESSIDEEYLP